MSNELQNIVAKWRAEADSITHTAWNHPCGHENANRQNMLRRCANELEATLPAAGGGVEAVAWIASECVEAIREAVQTLRDGGIDKGQALVYITDSLKTYDLRRQA